MPQGDREILKADIEDGYTKIANLLIEALAMCKLSGTQHGICLFIFRRTYGWGKSEDAISLPEFAAACDTSQPYISRQIKDLLKKNVILRVDYQPGKTPVYTFNTRITEWDKGCINVQGLSNQIRQGLYECARVGLSDCIRVNQPKPLEPPALKPPVKKERKKEKENSSSNTVSDTVPYVKIVELFHQLCPSYPRVITISENRKNHIGARYKQYGNSLDAFGRLFVKAEKSNFLKGTNDRGWKADFDWLMNETNMAKVLEGKYDRENGRASPMVRVKKETPEEALARINRELEAEEIGQEASGHAYSENSGHLPDI